jgi:hypothetical protein
MEHMDGTIKVQLNFFGPHIDKEDIPHLITLTSQSPSDVNQRMTFQKSSLESFFGLPLIALSAQILERYAEVSSADFHMPIVPHTERIFSNLSKPLKSAKVNYSLGDYLSVIASCGIVGEMLTILIWRINDIKINNKLLCEDDEKNLFGYPFERLSQDRKLNVLRTFNQITQKQVNDFHEIRKSRNRYLHSWEKEIVGEKDDAFEAIKRAFRLFREVTGIGISDTPGKITVNPLLVKLFKQEG